MKEDLHYRLAEQSDVKQLQQITLLAYGQFKNVISKANWNQWEKTFNNEDTFLTLLQTANCFVCEQNNKIVGMGFLIPHGNPTNLFEAGWAYIRLIGVHPEFEGKGIGRKITEMCIQSAKDTGEKTLALHTSEFQHAARYIYESMGFKKVKEFDLFNKKYWIYNLEL